MSCGCAHTARRAERSRSRATTRVGYTQTASEGGGGEQLCLNGSQPQRRRFPGRWLLERKLRVRESRGVIVVMWQLRKPESCEGSNCQVGANSNWLSVVGFGVNSND